MRFLDFSRSEFCNSATYKNILHSSQNSKISNSKQIATYVQGNGFAHDTVPISTKIISVICDTSNYFARIVKSSDGTQWAFQIVDYTGTPASSGLNFVLTYYYNA